MFKDLASQFDSLDLLGKLSSIAAFIGFFSFILSIYNFILNIIRNNPRIKVSCDNKKVLNIYHTDNNTLAFTIVVKNRSNNPITINNIVLYQKSKKKEYSYANKALRTPEAMSFPKDGHNISVPLPDVIEIPSTIDKYGSVQGGIFFSGIPVATIDNSLSDFVMKIKTSRGTFNKRRLFKNLIMIQYKSLLDH